MRMRAKKGDRDMENKIKISINVDREIYLAYKVEMLKSHTTPTADINKHIRQVAENKHP